MITTMFKRAFCDKIFLQVSSLVRRSRIKYSRDAPNDQNTAPEKEETASEKADTDSGNLSREDLTRLLDEAATYKDANDESWATTPYPAEAPVHPASATTEELNINPKEKSIVIFPGQGTLKVGDVHKYLRFPAAKEIFDIANEILGYNLLQLCLEGPQKKLDKTCYNQPATVVSSLAALERLREERPKVFETCIATAGYSVGELSALIFSGAISLEDGIRLVAERGNAMQAASEEVPQGMLSVYCTPRAELPKLLQDAKAWALDSGVSEPVCAVSIYLYTQSKILGGNEEALVYIEKHGEKMGLKKLRRLPVSGAFHTLLMRPALKRFKNILNEISIDTPRTAVYSNCTGLPYTSKEKIKALLAKQIITPVKWEQCMQRIYKRSPDVGFPRTFDVCSFGRMKTILKLINAKAADSCIVV